MSTQKPPDKLRMPADEFDRIMRGALQVKPEPKAEPEKPRRKPKRKPSAK